MRRFAHVVAFDDCPFDREHRGDVGLIGAVFAGGRLDGVVSGRVRRDGANSATVMAELIRGSRFVEHLQLIMLQGIAVAGFNVVDVFTLHSVTGLPVLVIAKKEPDYDAIHDTLTLRVRGGARKWAIIEALRPMEKMRGVWFQQVGLSRDDVNTILQRFAISGHYPEPVRVAHLIASGISW